jgi:hypothetical protein
MQSNNNTAFPQPVKPQKMTTMQGNNNTDDNAKQQQYGFPQLVKAPRICWIFRRG